MQVNNSVFYSAGFKKLLAVLCTALLTNASLAQDIGQITKQKPFEIHGAASAMVGYYASSGFNNTRKPYTYSIMAAPTISLYGIQIPFNFTFTEGSKSLKNPFAQFGINPYWKWIKVYAGWTNMKWSPTTLNGKTFLGIGVDINPSLFRFGAMYGRFNPAIKENLFGPAPQQPQYKRRGFGFKIGVGNEANYFDFIFLKAKDVAGSIPVPTDTLNQLDYNPMENAVFGIMSYQSFLKKKITWQLDGSISAITRNLNSQLLDLGTGFGTRFLKVVMPPRLSTSYAWAAHTNLSYKGEKLTLSFDYNRLQPEYQSMGLDYIMNDQEKITLVQSFPAAKKKVYVSLNEFFQRDDLNNRKAAKTNRAGLTAGVNFNPNQKFGIAINYSNYITFQQKGLKALNDSTKIMQLQQTVVVAPHYLIINTKMVHNITSALTYSRMDDLNKITSRYSKNSTINANLGYSLSVNKIALSFSPSFNVLYSKGSTFELLNVGPTLAVSKAFWKNKITTGVSFTFTAGRNNGAWNSKVLNNSISVGYRIDNHHSLKLMNYVMATFAATGDRREYKGDLTYTYSF